MTEFENRKLFDRLGIYKRLVGSAMVFAAPVPSALTFRGRQALQTSGQKRSSSIRIVPGDEFEFGETCPGLRVMAKLLAGLFIDVGSCVKLFSLLEYRSRPQVDGLGIIVLSGFLEELVKAFGCAVSVLQVDKRHPHVELFLFLSESDRSQGSSTDILGLVDLG